MRGGSAVSAGRHRSCGMRNAVATGGVPDFIVSKEV